MSTNSQLSSFPGLHLSWAFALAALAIGCSDVAATPEDKVQSPCDAVDCGDGDPCTRDVCNGVDGTCANPVAEDGDACSVDDVEGLCVGGVCAVCAGVRCDDGNACTDDRCNPDTGACEAPDAPDSISCPFAGGLPGVCEAGQCVDAGLCAGVDCGDGDPCTDDKCDKIDGSCSNPTSVDETSCEVGGVSGRCRGGTCDLCADAVCGDGNPCTADSCNPDGTCSNDDVENDTACFKDDKTGACRQGECDLCAGVTCNDDDVCTSDSCNPRTGACETSPLNDRTCKSDGFLGDCVDGTCKPRVCELNTTCDDGNPCTTDQCVCSTASCLSFQTRCQNTPAAEGASCGKGRVCRRGFCAFGGLLF